MSGYVRESYRYEVVEGEMVEHSTVGRRERGKRNRGLLYRNTSNIFCRYEVITYVKIRSITQRVRFYAINGGKENLILGHPWLESTNPSIDWNKGTVTISETKDQSLELSFAHLGAQGRYLNKNTCPLYTPKVNPRKETTLNPTEQSGLCRYLSTELPEQFME